MTVYYNEIDSYAAHWLRNLIQAGHIPAGDVDERSIVDVRPDDLRGYVQCHFFAGLGGWAYAARLAGWPDDRPIWTGSCPCQPFSAAGKGGGFDDERHLWPDFFRLIAECRPAIVFGEQVASPAGLAWLDLVSADKEGAHYAFGAADLCAAGVGAPHIRQRLWWVADSAEPRRRAQPERDAGADGRSPQEPGRLRDARELEYAARDGRQQWRAEPSGRGVVGGRGESRLGHAAGREQRWTRQPSPSVHGVAPGRHGAWDDLEWLPCTDDKARPTRPGLFPLAHGISFKLGSGSPLEGKSRVGMLRAAGNAIVPDLAAQFICACMETIDGGY